jgi:ubiquinone/menaquinone biosynthesis C-methylase UbiE
VPPKPPASGAAGWDDYADFYDWENAQTMARRDVAFWKRVARAASGPVLELGCGTGRVTVPLARSGVPLVGVDLSAPMLDRAKERLRRARLHRRCPLVRGDIRALPFAPDAFSLVAAPYGILQSLLADRDLTATLVSATRVLKPGGRLILELVADLPSWREYRNETKLRGWRAGGKSHLTLVESVRQDRRRGLTIFQQTFIERQGAATSKRTFDLTFRTLTLPQMIRRLEHAGLAVTAQLGSYTGDPWTPDAETWILIAEKRQRRSARASKDRASGKSRLVRG